MSKMRDWSFDATKIFEGKKVDFIGYMSDEEADEWGWDRAPIIMFTDGSWILASADDEGNNAGAFFTSERKMETIPRGGR
jgi:hypothetical protein